MDLAHDPGFRKSHKVQLRVFTLTCCCLCVMMTITGRAGGVRRLPEREQEERREREEKERGRGKCSKGKRRKLGKRRGSGAQGVKLGVQKNRSLLCCVVLGKALSLSELRLPRL